MKKLILSILICSLGSITYAQKESGQSLREQIRNNSMPGWQYDRSAVAAKTIVSNNEQHDQSLTTRIRKGTAANMKFMPVPAGAPPQTINTQKAVAARTVALPSEQPLQAEAPALKAATPALPTQQVANESQPAGKKE